MSSKTDTAVSFFIAVPGDDQASGIFGIGTSHDAAVQDAYAQSNSRPPAVIANDDGTWHVSTDTCEDNQFSDESEARSYAIQKGFIGRECTERLYRHIEANGCDASRFRWTKTPAGLDDLDIDQEQLDAAVAEVEAGFEGNTSQGEWRAETALADAHDYVDAYVVDDEVVDGELREALAEGTQLRTAADVAVRDLILAEISEREAA
ncbi:hypothetical protein MMB17_05560 [Methylobacterium organophilum]|uniref:hypothetical protein n=1 Tax=Methylobacterium organophilum TaxID=410 RepID=UPI001F12E495|nr:hypothetical protein [Methylobacterium organophilum]UMY18783.1 hypothetical protein MMB17_05560 [Methylobacterium organophilum]